MARSGMKPVYVGDIGVIVEQSKPIALPAEIDLDQLTHRQLCNLAALLGHKVTDIIGIDTCEEHLTFYTALDGYKMPEGYNLFDHCVYCKNCWRTYRLISIAGLD